jgi:outer membrane protein assembly factor BamB
MTPLLSSLTLILLGLLAAPALAQEPDAADLRTGPAADFSPSAAAASSSATQADWPTYGYDVQRTGYNPKETTLGVNNVSKLHEVWAFDLGANTISQPVFASKVNVNGTPTDILYEGSENGNFYAINAATGQKIWSRYLSVRKTNCPNRSNMFGVSSTAVLDRATNRVYVAGGDDKAYALDMSNGSIVTGWPVQLFSPTALHVWSAINVFEGKLYAVAAGYGDCPVYHGGVAQVDIATTKLSTFFPTGASGPSGGGIWGAAGVSVDPNSSSPGNVYLAVGNAIATPTTSEHYGYAEHVVRLNSSLRVLSWNYPGLIGEDVDFGATPLLFNASSCPKSLLAVENKSGVLLLYDRYAVPLRPLQRLQLANVNLATAGQFIGQPAFSPQTNMLYVSNPSDSSAGTFFHGIVALKVQSDCTLALAWQQQDGSNSESLYSLPYSAPTVANGVVYHGAGGSKVFAFNASTGQQLWSSSTIGYIFSAPIVVNGRLYVGAWDHKLHAFAP